MDNNLLTLDLYVMNDNRGVMVLNAANAEKSARIKGFFDALSFIAELIQLKKAIETGAHQNGHFLFKNNDANKSWLLHYRFVQGIVSLVLLLQNLVLGTKYNAVFEWKGTAKEFSASVDGMERKRNWFANWWFNWFR